MDIQTIFATNMKRIRKKQGLTQEQLAEKCGLHRTYIGGIEQARINVSLKNVGKIANALDANPAFLFTTPSPSDQDTETPNSVIDDDDDSVYYLGIQENGELTLEAIDVDDPDLSIQILVGLIQDGYTDEELVRRYTETKQAILDFYRESRHG